MGFRLVTTSMTLNVLERHNSPHFAFFSRNSIALQANYVTMVEDRPIMSTKILSFSSGLPLLAKTNAPCSTVSLYIVLTGEGGTLWSGFDKENKAQQHFIRPLSTTSPAA